MSPRETADVAIVGFGFAGLSTLAHLARADRPLRVAVVAADAAGTGLAYGTRDPLHLLNVPADRMGALSDHPGDFATWLGTPAAEREATSFGAAVCGPGDFASRALYGRYLRQVRATAAAADVEIDFVAADADRLRGDREGWVVTAGRREVRARACVLATGNEVQPLFDHPGVRLGPWSLGLEVADWRRPVALVGTGLTAVDAVISLRRLGFGGEIHATSRNGLLPMPHDPEVLGCDVDLDAERIGTLAELLAAIGRLTDDGHDLRAVVDALRPATQALWQRLPREDQREVVERWSPVWSIVRHRMAPRVARIVRDELRSGGLRVAAGRDLRPAGAGDALSLTTTARDGTVTREPVSAIIDCTGPRLDWARSRRPLLRDLAERGICVRHHTGLGVVADDLEIAPGLFALGGLLTGQLWETIAVPELRDQAARIAERSLVPVGS